MATGTFSPPVGFYFKVSIDGLPDADSEFQDVAGLSQTLETVTLNEGGENRFAHQLPVRVKPEKLILKRGLRVTSQLQDWCRKAVEEFQFTPKNLEIFLLDPALENSLQNPLMSWHVRHAYPTKWSISAFNAMNNEIITESIELNYNYFEKSFPV